MNNRREFLFGASALLLPAPIAAAEKFTAKFNPNVTVGPLTILGKATKTWTTSYKIQEGKTFWNMDLAARLDDGRTQVYGHISSVAGHALDLDAGYYCVPDASLVRPCNVTPVNKDSWRIQSGFHYPFLSSDEQVTDFATELIRLAKVKEAKKHFLKTVKEELSQRIENNQSLELSF